MKTKKLALINGVVGLVGGIFLILAIFILAASAVNDVANSFSSSTVSTSSTTLTSMLTVCIKIALLVLGIMGSVYYKEDERISAAPHVLLIVGGALSIIPFLGWVGGILAIIGGSLYLSSLKRFEE